MTKSPDVSTTTKIMTVLAVWDPRQFDQPLWIPL